jgi:hypothetical protein
MSRREFTPAQKRQIVERSKNEDGDICCERCKLVLRGKAHEIDHVIAEGLRPDADKLKPITIAEGQLLGRDCCHRGADGKTNQDVKAIAKSNRQFDRANGIEKRTKQPIPKKPKPARGSRHDWAPELPPRQLYEKVTT